MRHLRLGILLLFSVLVLLPSCAAKIKQKFLDEPYRTGTLSVPLMVTDIEVTDGRNSVNTRGIKAPKFTFKQKGDTIVPRLTIEHEKVIHDEIRQSVNGGGPGVRIKATLKEGVQQYTLGFFNAREYAKAAVTIDLFNGAVEPYFFSTTGEVYYEVKSTMADTVFQEMLYRKALKTAVHKAFESVAGFLEKREKQDAREYDSTTETD
jgi:hypothetical protein